MLPPSSAFHPHLCTPVPAFVLPQQFTRPHNDLDQELPETNLTANKQTNKMNQPRLQNPVTDFSANSVSCSISAPDNANTQSSTKAGTGRTPPFFYHRY